MAVLDSAHVGHVVDAFGPIGRVATSVGGSWRQRLRLLMIITGPGLIVPNHRIGNSSRLFGRPEDDRRADRSGAAVRGGGRWLVPRWEQVTFVLIAVDVAISRSSRRCIPAWA